MLPWKRNTVAILGPNSVPEHVLAHLLEAEGYAARLIKAPPTGVPAALPERGSAAKLLDDVDIVLLWPTPTLKDATREAFVDAMGSSVTTAKIPTLALPPALETALQDELAADVPL